MFEFRPFPSGALPSSSSVHKSMSSSIVSFILRKTVSILNFYERICPFISLSVRPFVGLSVFTVCNMLVMLSLFGLLEATYAVYAALF